MIFACLGMIIIFNVMGNKLIDNAEGDISTVLPEQSMILTLEYPSFSIERLGRSWRITPADKLPPEGVQQVITNWLALTGEVALSSDSEEEGYRVMVWLAGNEQPTRFWIQPNAGYVTNIIEQKTWRIAPSLLAKLD